MFKSYFQNFQGEKVVLFGEKEVDLPNKIPAKTLFHTFQENNSCKKYTFFKKWKNVKLKVLAFIPLQYPI